jgi:hypothetical protein
LWGPFLFELNKDRMLLLFPQRIVFNANDVRPQCAKYFLFQCDDQ